MGIHLYTAGTPSAAVETTLASSGGLLINIDSATGDIAQTASGWIEDEKYGFYAVEFATSISAEFDTAVTRTGSKTLKLSTLDATGRARFLPIPANNYSTAATNLTNSAKLIPVKASTKYRMRVFAKTNNVAASSVSFDVYVIDASGASTYNGSSNGLTGTNDWTLLQREFTTAASAVWLGYTIFNGTAGNISDAWFDINSMTLEEVVEPVANSLTSSSPSLVSFTAVGSTDNIDQSLDTGGAAAFTYVPPVAIAETATNRQTFVPTKSKITRIGVWVVAKGTGNWTLTVHDASNVVQATATIANASLTNGAFNYFNVPCNVTALASYHFHVTSTVLDGTLKTGVTLDCEGASYIENYYKPTTNFKTSQNNSTVSISADEDGFLNGSVVNLVTGTATFTETFGTFYLLQYTISGSDLIAKVQLPGVGLSASFTCDKTLNYSSDGITYGSTFPTGFSKVWVKILSYSGFASFSYSIQFSTASINILRNYPTNKDIIKQYTKTLGSPTTTATYRATKWGFPAIEYLPLGVDSTGLVARYDFLGNANDSSGNGYNLTLTGAPSLTTGRFGDSSGAYSMNGTTQYASTPTINLTDIPGYTLCFWFNPVTKLTRSRPIASTATNFISAYYGDAGGSGTNLQWFIGDGTTFSSARNTASVVTFGVWQFIAITYDKVNGRLYKNGTLLDTNAFMSTTINLADSIRYGSNGSNYCEGSFGEMRIFQRVLSDVELLTMYNASKEYQFLDVDTTATGSTVAFSELGTSYTTVADGASLAITSTSTPSIWVKHNITANRLYLSSNDYNVSSDKDGSNTQSVVYQVKPNPQIAPGNMNSNIKLFYG